MKHRDLFLISAGLVALLCVLVYARALGGPLFFDDVPNLLENSRLYLDNTIFDQWRIASFHQWCIRCLPPGRTDIGGNFGRL